MRFIIIAVILSGCSSLNPYAEIGLNYQIDSETDYWVQTDRPWQCDRNPKFDGEVGVETRNNWSLGLHHESWVLCGTGVNRHPEVYSNDIRLSKKWGGRK